jgi:hypothetical protein
VKLETRTASPGGWVVVVPDVTPGPDPVHVAVGGVVQPAFVSEGKLWVKCPQLQPGTHAVQVDAGPRWAITIE